MEGRNAKTYINVDGDADWTSPDWDEIPKIIDETVTPSAEVNGVYCREFDWQDNEITGLKLEWTCTYRYKKKATRADAIYDFLVEKFLAGTPVYMRFLDNTTGAEARGWMAPMKITQLPQKRDVGSSFEVSVTAVSCLYDDGTNDVWEPEAVDDAASS